MTSPVTTLVHFLTLVSVMRSTKTHGMPEKWFVNDYSQHGVFSPRGELWPKDPTECTCTCEVVQGSPTKKLLNDKTSGSLRSWNEAEGGKNHDDDEEQTIIDWSSDGQSSAADYEQTIPSELEDADDYENNIDDSNNRDNNNRDNNNQDNNNNSANDNNIDNAIEDTVDTPDRYKGYTWGHGSRFPWMSLKDLMCLRKPCELDSDCCLRWNICDRSAKVCSNCWYGHPCLSERDCCHDFPYCQRQWKKDEYGQLLSVQGGRCADRR